VCQGLAEFQAIDIFCLFHHKCGKFYNVIESWRKVDVWSSRGSGDQEHDMSGPGVEKSEDKGGEA